MNKIQRLFDIGIRKIERKRHSWKQYAEGCNYEVTPDQAREELQQFWPDCKSSCYVTHRDKKENQYDLSIIIPAYNVEKYLQACLNSVQKQKTKVHYQTIVVNDGSTDKTKEILEKYESLENWVIIHQENKGFSGARNTGIDAATGKYLMFLDSDDKLSDDAIENLMTCAMKNDAQVVAGNFVQVTTDGKIIENGGKYKNRKIEAVGNLHGQPFGKVYKRCLFDHLNFPEKYWYEDSIFAQILWPMTNSVYTISDCVYEYTLNPGSITQTGQFKPKAVDSLYITE